MASEKQIQANRRNALRSTGPKTEAGKARSSRNAVKHGMTARAEALPPDDYALYKERCHEWMCDYRPQGGMERYLVAAAALAAVRIDRCARSEFALMARRRKRVISEWHKGQRRKVLRLIRRLDGPAIPPEVAERLESFTAGCDWLVAQWETLGERLDDPAGAGLDTDDAERFLTLLGLDPAGPEPDETPEAAQLRLDLETVGQPDRHPSHLAAARSRLGEWVGSEMIRLADQAEELWRNQDAPALAEKLDLAGHDGTPQGDLRRRYASSASLELHRALGGLEKRRKELRRQRREEDLNPGEALVRWTGIPQADEPASPADEPAQPSDTPPQGPPGAESRNEANLKAQALDGYGTSSERPDGDIGGPAGFDPGRSGGGLGLAPPPGPAGPTEAAAGPA